MELLATRPLVLRSLPPWLVPELERIFGEGVASATVIGRRGGGAGQCYVLRLRPAGGRVVLKLAHDGAGLEREHSALRSVHATTGADAPVRFPRPLGLVGGGAGYLMEFVAGDRLPDVLGRLPSRGAPPPDLAPRLAAGLRGYHAALDEAYGDFHPGNVIIGPGGRLILLDPTASDPSIRAACEGAPSFMTADLGLWAFSAAASASSLLNRPLLAPRLAPLTLALIAAEGNRHPAWERAAVVRSVFDLARVHITWLKRSPRLEGRLAALVGAPALAMLEAASLRAASQDHHALREQ
ncbi:MAG: hypothetical protein ACR2HN_06885 [Tepidiformaceae bacterium]